MKNVLNVICICFGVMFYQGKYSAGIQADSLKMIVPVTASFSAASQLKRKLPAANESKGTFNYPNPFGSSTIISYRISSSGYVTINIYDLLGCEVCGYKEGYKEVGDSKILVDLSFLYSGVYFYEIKVDGRRLAINRLTLLK